MTLSEELNWRGFVYQTTYKKNTDLDKAPITFYWGVDPSADSMTIGNLAIAMMVRHFIDSGHKAVLLVGGATGLIGDPDGKANERELKTIDTIVDNKHKITEQYKTVFAGQSFEVVDNYDWFKDISFLQFLRDTGKHVPLRQMVGRDFVQNRLGDTGSGISYAEFSYSLIQAYDFLQLYRNKNVSLQVCGADQWGNSIAGVDLIRRVTGGEANVWSAPLIVNKTTGVKFGKSESGAVWLDSTKTSVFKFYQFWLNVDDDGVADYLKIYTLLSRTEIDAIIDEFEKNRKHRIAQKTLAFEVTKLIHGEEHAFLQQKISKALTDESILSKLNDSEVEILRGELPSLTLKIADKNDVLAVLVTAGLASSMSEARRLLSGHAIYLNNRQIEVNAQFNSSHGKFVLLRRGKAFKDSAIIEIES
jgi:tyrosyl-tRNA synthetase